MYEAREEQGWSRTLEPTQVDACRAMNRCPIALSNAFFCRANITRIQRLIQQQIAAKMGYAISDQSEPALVNIMRNTYLQYSTFSDDNVTAEIAYLNDVVTKLVLPDIASSIKAYIAYVKDASSLPEPAPLPAVVSVKGTKSLPAFQGFW